MAFGGYKFKGYKVVRANLATNTYANWCLLVHQARIKAFMESCALSGAQWHFSKTNGALSSSFSIHGLVGGYKTPCVLEKPIHQQPVILASAVTLAGTHQTPTSQTNHLGQNWRCNKE